MYIDTHCHLDQILARTKIDHFEQLKSQHYPDNFEKCITISCGTESLTPTLELMKNDDVYGAFGIHPHDAKEYNDALEQKLSECMAHPKCLAWGEIGLDYFYKHSEPEIQKEIFTRQIKQAIIHKKPLIIHTREAEEDTLAIMKEHIPTDWKIHVHCFTSSNSMATELISHFSHLYIGFTGVITFNKTEGIAESVRSIPLNRILLETDAPYMTPNPHRGSPCHSGYIPFIAQKISAIKETPLEEVYLQIRKNTQELFGL